MTAKRKIALVTGGNRGLGFETCRQLAQLGLTVISSPQSIRTTGTIKAVNIKKNLAYLTSLLIKSISKTSR